MFDKFRNKWWPSIYKNKRRIKSQDPEKDNQDEMVKLKSTESKEKNKTDES